MLEKLSKSSFSFMMTSLDRPHHILSYSYPFKVFFFVVGKLAEKKDIIHSYTLKTKINFHLRENQVQSRPLDHEKCSKSHIGQSNLMNPFLFLYIEETNKPYMCQRIKWA